MLRDMIQQQDWGVEGNGVQVGVLYRELSV